MHILSLSHAVSPPQLASFFFCLFSMFFINWLWAVQMSFLNDIYQQILVVNGRSVCGQYEHLFSTNSCCQWMSKWWPDWTSFLSIIYLLILAVSGHPHHVLARRTRNQPVLDVHRCCMLSIVCIYTAGVYPTDSEASAWECHH